MSLMDLSSHVRDKRDTRPRRERQASSSPAGNEFTFVCHREEWQVGATLLKEECDLGFLQKSLAGNPPDQPYDIRVDIHSFS
jgi:hypothetical protein